MTLSNLVSVSSFSLSNDFSHQSACNQLTKSFEFGFKIYHFCELGLLIVSDDFDYIRQVFQMMKIIFRLQKFDEMIVWCHQKPFRDANS